MITWKQYAPSERGETSPKPKQSLIKYKRALSLLCNEIWNIALTLLPTFRFLLLITDMWKQPSASMKPEMYHNNLFIFKNVFVAFFVYLLSH